MLTRANYGTTVCGRVEHLTGVIHREGQSEKGKKYSFYQQTVTLTMGQSQVEVNATADSDPGAALFGFDLDEVVRLKVVTPRIYNGKVSYDLAK